MKRFRDRGWNALMELMFRDGILAEELETWLKGIQAGLQLSMLLDERDRARLGPKLSKLPPLPADADLILRSSDPLSLPWKEA